MKLLTRDILSIMIFNFFIANSAIANDDYERLEPFIDKIEAVMPKNWTVIKKEVGEIPEYHYEDMEYEGPKGIYLLIAGDQDIENKWKDKEGVWQKDFLTKEAISLWVMFPEYHQSWKRFFVFKGHVRTPEVYSGRNVKVYGQEVSYWPPSSHQKFKEIEPQIGMYTASPEHTVQSWVTWKEDIKEALRASLEKPN